MRHKLECRSRQLDAATRRTIAFRDGGGSTISGNTPHIVIVKTNPGYAPNPGHAGTGTVVLVIC